VKPDPHRPEGGPLPAERIRRSWQAWECAAMGPVVELGAGRRRVVGLGFVAGRAGVGVEVGVIRAVRVRDRAGRGSRGCR
jgi:hypothetical protein